MQIVEKIIDQGQITNKDIREMFGISDNSALKMIRKLTELKVIERKGEGKNVHYTLT